LRATLLARSAMICLLFAGVSVVQPNLGLAQQGQAAPAVQLLNKAQLDQLVAPIALYSDPLLAQVLMASTYPLQIVEATRWAQANTSLSGAALTQALASEPWDESVKALVATPTVLAMMSQKLDWTQNLGTAVAAQQSDVMAAIQRLRQQAQAHGTLKTTSQQIVNVSTTGPAPVIEVSPAQPEVIYVPYYDPAVVYGAWLYPAYPPYYFPAPYGYVAGPGLWFGTGVVLGFGWDHWGNWGKFNWYDGNIYLRGNVDAHWVNNHVNVQVNEHVNVDVNDIEHANVDNHINDDVGKDDIGKDDAFKQDDHAFDEHGDDGFGRDDEKFDHGGDHGGFDRGGGGHR
jgi:uncharacterized protein DUF3300